MIARLDEMTAPVEVGRFYLVPVVRGCWFNKVGDWPVIGPRHNDSHCLDFAHEHYHLDARFLDTAQLGGEDWVDWRAVLGAPLMMNETGRRGRMPAPVWLRRKCRRLVNPHAEMLRGSLVHSPRWRCHFEQWEGRQARHDGRGWVCPHRKVPLADHPSVDGVITCPLHLLKIDAASGKVLP